MSTTRVVVCLLIPALGRWRKKAHKPDTSLGYIQSEISKTLKEKKCNTYFLQINTQRANNNMKRHLISLSMRKMEM